MNELIKITPSIEPEAKEFETKLKNIIENNDIFLKDYLVEFLFNKPKRLRPIFTYLFSKILEIDDKITDNIALSVELIHNASLIHDDIIDEECLRRNLPTFYNKFNSKIAVLEGDFLLSSALEILSDCPIEVVKIFSKKIKETLLGELNQNSKLNKIQTVEEYLNKTLSKTTNLFLAGLESLFCLKKSDRELENNLINFMKNYSTAFQIKNDIDNIKNNNSTDIKCGNYTLPVIYFFLENDNREFNINAFQNKQDKYINKAIEKVAEFETLAIKSLEKIENSVYKKEAIELCKYTLKIS